MRPATIVIASFALASTTLALPYGARDHTLTMRDVIAPDYLLGGAPDSTQQVSRTDASGTLSSRTVSLKPGLNCARGWKRCCGLCPAIPPAVAAAIFPAKFKTTRSVIGIEDLN